MRHLVAGLLAVFPYPAIVGVGNAVAQQQASFSEWTIPGPPLTSESLPGAALPDSVRRKVGYQHWKGAAIGAGVGAVLGSALAFGLASHCSDCTVTTGDRAQAALVVTGAGGVFGFLVGLASPKYVWESLDTAGVKYDRAE